MSVISREAYQGIERRVINRMKLMANEGLINLVETNERMFAEEGLTNPYIQAGPPGAPNGDANMKQVAGW